MNEPKIETEQTRRSLWLWAIVGSIAAIAIVDLWTSVVRIFGYLYIVPILISCYRLGPKATTAIAIVCVGLNLSVFLLHFPQELTEVIITNRVIAFIGIVLAAYLGNRAIYCQRKVDLLQNKIYTQRQLLYLREDFSATLTHDLKTPLLGAIATIEAFERDRFGATTESQRQVLTTMKRSHQNSLQLLDTLMEIYRADNDGIVLYRSRLNLADVIIGTIERLSDLARARELSIEFHPANRDQLWMHGDGFQLDRVMGNLISNSIKYSPRGDKIEIEIASRDLRLLVRILDNSNGIPPDVLPYLFDRYYPGHPTANQRSTGLGLYLSRQIIDAHGGSIWAENRAPRGTILSIELPLSVSAVVEHEEYPIDPNPIS
jgi:two-component system, NarL family, sensor kinase